jgi:hypothetical protein
MAYYHRYDTPDTQHLFDTHLRGLFFFGRLLFKAFVYLPHLFIAYLLSTLFLTQADSGLAWCGLILLMAYILHWLIQYLLVVTKRLKIRQHLLWPFLLLVITTFTCGLPAYVVGHITGNLLSDADQGLQPLLTLAFTLHLLRHHGLLRMLLQ